MANPEHLAILKQGVNAWNEWREKNPDVRLDLCGAHLRMAKLREADLNGANLSGADLGEARLTRADLSTADLRNAYLIDANLKGADLRNADLSEASLSGASLKGADLRNAYLIKTGLVRTDLWEANLSGADLTRANLREAYLSRADLSGANLSGADLGGADLGGADLQQVDVRFCQLCRCNLKQADLTGAKLYATARDDWIIEGIKCRYVFWDAKGEIRSPEDRDLAPGEFESLYRTLPTIEYVFQHGMTPMDPLIMDRVVQAVSQQKPEYNLKVDSICARGLAPSIRFTVQQEEHKEPALQMVVAGYESRLQRLEAEKDRLYELLGRAIDKAGTRLIEAGPGAVVAMDNASVNIDQHIEYITNLRDAVAALPEDSPTFAKTAKKTALDIIGGALKDVAKGQVKEAAKQIYELGKDLGPVVVNTAAYAFLKT